MNPGIYDNLSIDEYHSSQGISRSSLMSFRKSPKHFHYEHILGNRKQESSDALIFGNALHTYVLEPHLFNETFHVWHKQNGRKPASNTTAWTDIVADAQGKTLICAEDLETIMVMADAIKQNEIARGLVEGGRYEKSIYWEDTESGLLCKCRPDILHFNFVADLKTTTDASFSAFQRSLLNYGYYLQCAFMYEGLKAATGVEYKDFIFIAIEKEPPYVTVCYHLDELALLQGIADFKQNLQEIKRCMETNDWSGYPNQIITLPNWSR